MYFSWYLLRSYDSEQGMNKMVNIFTVFLINVLNIGHPRITTLRSTWTSLTCLEESLWSPWQMGKLVVDITFCLPYLLVKMVLLGYSWNFLPVSNSVTLNCDAFMTCSCMEHRCCDYRIG